MKTTEPTRVGELVVMVHTTSIHKTKYVLGFVFDSSFGKVLLIRKNRPQWQKGKFNGIGGHIDKNETALNAIARETYEETGRRIEKEQWVSIITLESKMWIVYVFATVYNNTLSDFKSMTDEQIEWAHVNKLPLSIIMNISWLVPLSIDTMKNKEIRSGNVNYY